MNTATVTWIYYENFGTFLQAYALQRSIVAMGHDNAIIDDSPLYTPSILVLTRKWIIDTLKGRSNKSHRLYRKFAKEFLTIDKGFNRNSNSKDSYDLFICGSDQIWSPYLKFSPYYYLGFTCKKKIAYAPSTGTGASNEEYRKNVKHHLESFSHLSVREEDGARMLSSFIDKDIKVVLDPTLLLKREDWEKITTEQKENEPYILCYLLTPNSTYLDFVKEYAKRRNLKVKIFNTSPSYSNTGFQLLEAGPREFVTYIKNAETVFTDSFHSSIFSILFHKEFVTFKRFKDGGKKDQNSRIANLFQKLGLSRYFIGEESLSGIETIEKPDFNKVDKILDILREESKEYLRNAIEN